MIEAQVRMQKAILWEQAKGLLRAMVAADGYLRLCEPGTATLEQVRTARWEIVDREIEAFISKVENEGLAE